METFRKEQFWAELDAIGEDEVRARIATKKYGVGNHKLELAELWLEQRNRAAEAKSTENQRAIDRGALYASWAAVGISLVALIVSIAK